ncbi:MAG: hypothetical protein LBU21_07535 [Treponema sp.]|nr:hypothetical protein [Treponema sp.]
MDLLREISAAIPNSTVPKPKRDLINISAFLSAGKKRGPSPSFFPPPPHPAFLGLFSALLRNGIAAKKEKRKVKKMVKCLFYGGKIRA